MRHRREVTVDDVCEAVIGMADWDEDGDGAEEGGESPRPCLGTPHGRLYALRGMPCPLCRRRGHPERVLAWTGVSLACAQGHGWSNPDALRDDLLAELRGPGWEE